MKTFIIHVSNDYEREKHIRKELENKELDTEFINDGDKADLSEMILEKYFSGEMREMNNASRISNAYKHFIAYEKIVICNYRYAMILEDDILFYSNFNKQLGCIEDEIKKSNINNFIISLEDSLLKYVRGSDRVKNKYIYPETRSRTTGAYLIDINASNNILAYLKINKCSLHIGWFHNQCSENKIIQIYWCHPPISTQGTANGKIKSLISNNKTGRIRIIIYNILKIYKKLLYRIR